MTEINELEVRHTSESSKRSRGVITREDWIFQQLEQEGGMMCRRADENQTKDEWSQPGSMCRVGDSFIPTPETKSSRQKKGGLHISRLLVSLPFPLTPTTSATSHLLSVLVVKIKNQIQELE